MAHPTDTLPVSHITHQGKTLAYVACTPSWGGSATAFQSGTTTGGNSCLGGIVTLCHSPKNLQEKNVSAWNGG